MQARPSLKAILTGKKAYYRTIDNPNPETRKKQRDEQKDSASVGTRISGFVGGFFDDVCEFTGFRGEEGRITADNYYNEHILGFVGKDEELLALIYSHITMPMGAGPLKSAGLFRDRLIQGLYQYLTPLLHSQPADARIDADRDKLNTTLCQVLKITDQQIDFALSATLQKMSIAMANGSIAQTHLMRKAEMEKLINQRLEQFLPRPENRCEFSGNGNL